MNYQQSLAYLEELNVFGMRLGLSRIRRLLTLLGEPQQAYRTIHVTGTNGKGSVSSLLAGILSAAGLKTGLYISPHLVRYTERMQVDGQEITERDFAAALTETRAKIDQMLAEGEECPTQFEAITTAAFLYFARQNVDYAVIEVGLGGLLDSTNVIVPEVSVITNVAFEHAKYCGGTLAGIAHHKAGIIKEGVPVVTAAEGEPLAIIKETAQEKHARLAAMGQDFFAAGEDFSENGQRFSYAAPHIPKKSYMLRLLGAHQVKNAALAVAAAHLLQKQEMRLTEHAIETALRATTWPARFEVIDLPIKAVGQGTRQRIVIDGAHNPAGMETLRVALDAYFKDTPRVFLLGILADKEVNKMLQILLRQEDVAVMTPPDSDRAATAVQLKEIAEKYAAQVFAFDDNQTALQKARELAGKRQDLLVLAGSLYLVGGLREHLLREEAGHGQTASFA